MVSRERGRRCRVTSSPITGSAAAATCPIAMHATSKTALTCFTFATESVQGVAVVMERVALVKCILSWSWKVMCFSSCADGHRCTSSAQVVHLMDATVFGIGVWYWWRYSPPEARLHHQLQGECTRIPSLLLPYRGWAMLGGMQTRTGPGLCRGCRQESPLRLRLLRFKTISAS